MLQIVLPKRPVPRELEDAVVQARDARDAAAGDPAKQKEAEEHHQRFVTATEAIQKHYEEVGTERVAIPREIEAGGRDAINGFIASQVERLAVEAAEPPKAKRTRSRSED